MTKPWNSFCVGQLLLVLRPALVWLIHPVPLSSRKLMVPPLKSYPLQTASALGSPLNGMSLSHSSSRFKDLWDRCRKIVRAWGGGRPQVFSRADGYVSSQRLWQHHETYTNSCKTKIPVRRKDSNVRCLNNSPTGMEDWERKTERDRHRQTHRHPPKTEMERMLT